MGRDEMLPGDEGKSRKDDKTLVQQCLEGNQKAFEILIDRYKNVIYAIAMCYVRNFHDVQDVIQDALIEAYRSLSSLKDGQKFANWLRRITVNRAKMWVRKQQALRTQIADLLEQLCQNQKSDGRIDIQNSIRKHQDLVLQQKTIDAIEALEEKYRLPIILHYLRGHSYKEVSQILKLPVSTVHSRLQDGRQRLREELSNLAEEVNP